MTALPLLPLLPAAIAATALALLDGVSPALVPFAAVTIAIGCGGLAFVSRERMRRLAWTAAAVIATVCALRLVGPAAGGGLGAFVELRTVLGEPLRRLVPEPESGILLGIALGDRASISADLAYAFARSGTSHRPSRRHRSRPPHRRRR